MTPTVNDSANRGQSRPELVPRNPALGSAAGPQSALASIRTNALGRALRRSVRIPLLCGHAVLGLVLQATLFTFRPVLRSERVEREVTRRWHGGLCRLVGLDLRVRGCLPDGPCLVVSNHISWLDIPVIGSCLAVSFLSKSEVRNWPIVGWLATNAGTLYIARGAHGVRDVTRDMSNSLFQGRHVAFFPEGTTTAGDAVRRFLPPLFAAAVEAGVPVQPVAVRYPHGGGTHPHAPFVDDESLVTHIWRLLGSRGMVAEVTFCAPIEDGSDRRRLARTAYQAIFQVLVGEADGMEAADPVAIGLGDATG